MKDASLAARAAWKSVQGHWLAAASDLFLSEQLRLPVGMGVAYEARVMSKLRPLPSEADIVFHLDLPAVRGLPTRELLSIRTSEADAFEGFRIAIRRAMKERMNATAAPNAEQIAGEIRDDVVMPSLNDIRRRLHAAEKLLERKHLIHIGLTGLATVCGLLGAAPPALALTGAAVGSSVTAQFKAFEEQRDIALSDMYFLWRVEQHQDQARHGKPVSKRKRR